MFLAVIEEKSFSGAGRSLGMTQPAVSNHLRALEERFGVELLSRGRLLCPTPAGEALAARARNILGEAAALEGEMASHGGPRGSLMIGASSTPAEFLMPRVAATFSGRYPEVALEIKVYDSEAAVHALLDRETEAVVVGREVEDARLVSQVIEEETLVPIVAAGDESFGSGLDVEELAKRSFVLRERGSATRLAAEAGLAAVGVSPKVVMELGSNGAVAGAVAAGAGIGVVPERYVGTHPEVREVSVRSLVLRRPFVLVTEKNRSLSPAALAFIETCIGEEHE